MALTLKELYIDGVKMPTPALEGVTITPNKIWSENTGRLEQSAAMAGTITAIKRKLEIKWPPLTMAEAAVIDQAVSSLTPFHTLRFTDQAGAAQTMTVYFGDPTYTQYSYSEGYQLIQDVKVSAIEQ